MRNKNSAAKTGKNPWAERPHPRGMAGRTPWNRGLTWDQMFDPAKVMLMRVAASQSIRIAQETLRSAPEIEAQRRLKLSAIARRSRLGQYRQGSGRGRKGYYRGWWCDSSYELAFVIYALDEGLAFERNRQTFPYTFEGRIRHWIPDFRLTDGTYLEIKGYETDQARAKFAAFPHALIVVGRQQLGFVLDYVIAKYGKNFVELYE